MWTGTVHSDLSVINGSRIRPLPMALDALNALGALDESPDALAEGRVARRVFGLEQGR